MALTTKVDLKYPGHFPPPSSSLSLLSALRAGDLIDVGVDRRSPTTELAKSRHVTKSPVPVGALAKLITVFGVSYCETPSLKRLPMTAPDPLLVL